MKKKTLCTHEDVSVDHDGDDDGNSEELRNIEVLNYNVSRFILNTLSHSRNVQNNKT